MGQTRKRTFYIIGFSIAECKKSESRILFQIGNASPVCRTTLIDMESQFILARQDTFFFSKANIRMHFGMQYAEQRVIFDAKGEIVDTIDVVSGEDIKVGHSIIRNREDRIKNRKYRQRVEKLYNSREFRRYGKTQERDTLLLGDGVELSAYYGLSSLFSV